MRQALLALLLIGAVGCGHAAMRGSIVMKVSDTDAHVCMGVGEVAAGDRVRLYRNICTNPKGATAKVDLLAPGGICTREKVTDGEVAQVLNEHYSVVRFASGTAFREGDTVEKVKP